MGIGAFFLVGLRKKNIFLPIHFSITLETFQK